MPLVLNLPLRIRNRVKTESYFYLNMNAYRNAPFHELSDMKIKFAEMVQNQIAMCPKFEWVEFKYILFPGTAREMDTNNICSIVDKFFCDAFVKAGKLFDDNYKYLRKSSFEFGEIDRKHPRVELHITGQEKEEQMQLQALLDHNDFMEALDAHVRKTFPVPEGTTPQIDITAGRGDKGYSAVVTYASATDTQPAPSAATASLAQSLKEQGNSTNRTSATPLDLTASKAPVSEPVTEDVPARKEPAAEPALAAMSGEVIPAEPKADSVFTKPEVVTEAETVDAEAEAKPAVKPLFNFGG